MTRTCLIYGLVDPRTPLVRYVGKTTCSLVRRLSNHLYKARSGRTTTACGDWLRTLLAAGIRPDIVLLEIVHGTGQTAERRWIKELPNLLNASPGGNGAYRRASFPKEYIPLLGVISDQRIAEQLGMSWENVGYHRRELGIVAGHDKSRAQKPPRRQIQVPFSAEVAASLGKVHDQCIADMTGLTRQAVRHRRELLGIAACTTPHQPKGARHGMASISEETARCIKQEFAAAASGVPGFIKYVAAKYGVSYHTVFDIKRGKTWRHLS